MSNAFDPTIVPDTPCLTAGCRFTGNTRWGNYCSQCYRNRNERQLNQLDLDDDFRVVYPGLADAREEDGLMKCPKCFEFYGRVERNGVCDDCLAQMNDVPEIKNKPGKCKKCGHFFGSAELAGYCNDCFMKMTQEEAERRASYRRDVRPTNHAHNNSVSMAPVQPHPLGFDRISSPPLAPVISDLPIMVDVPSQTPRPQPQQYYGNASAPYPSLRQQQNPADPPSYTAVMSHNPPLPPPVNPFPPPSPSPPSNPPPRPSPPSNPPPPRPQNSSPPVPKPRRSHTAVHLVETCFVCDSGKQIALSNMICQQHAIQVREIFRRKESVADSPSSNGRGTEEGDRMLRGWDVVYGPRNERQFVDGRDPNPPVQLPAATDSRQGLFNAVDRSPDAHEGRYVQRETALCNTPGCDYYGVQDCDGYCQNCYYPRQNRFS